MLKIYTIRCDKTKRPTCKDKKELAKFLKVTTFNVISFQNVVVEDQFESQKDQQSRFKGD